MDGVLNINKPAGMTSHDVVLKLRRILKEKKVGHTGTLDPGATGVLPICFGKATKIIQYLQNDEKGYEGTITLGIVTDSLDSDGEILGVFDCDNVVFDRIKSVFDSFKGEIDQIPPMVSAVKVQGKRLYELARQGKTVDRPSRRVKIFDLDIIRIYKEKVDGVEPPRDFTKIDFRVRCSKGTYVRSLAADIGKTLGCGAIISRLIRTESDGFELKDSIGLMDIQNNPEIASRLIKSMDEVLSFMPRVVINNLARTGFLNGIPLNGSGVVEYDNGFQAGKLLRVHDEAGNLLGLCEALVSDPKTLASQDIVCKTVKVLGSTISP